MAYFGRAISQPGTYDYPSRRGFARNFCFPDRRAVTTLNIIERGYWWLSPETARPRYRTRCGGRRLASLWEHPKVERVHYLGLSSHPPSVDSSLATQPAMWAGSIGDSVPEAAGIPPGLIRPAVGLGHPDDLLEDIDTGSRLNRGKYDVLPTFIS